MWCPTDWCNTSCCELRRFSSAESIPATTDSRAERASGVTAETCAKVISQPRTGRPCRYCGSTCRQCARRHRTRRLPETATSLVSGACPAAVGVMLALGLYRPGIRSSGHPIERPTSRYLSSGALRCAGLCAGRHGGSQAVEGSRLILGSGRTARRSHCPVRPSGGAPVHGCESLSRTWRHPWR